MLDTPMNRSFGGDTETWTPLETVSGRIRDWTEGRASPENGALYKLVTDKKGTEWVSV